MNGPPASRSEPGRGELPDLIVGEAVVGGGLLRVLHEEAGSHRGRHGLLQRVERGLALPQLDAESLQVLQAEVPPQDGGLAQRHLRRLGHVGRSARDEGSDRGRDKALGVLRQRPCAVDLLDHRGVAVGVGELLHDERDAFGLGVHGRRAGRVDLAPEHMPEELGGFDLAETAELQPADHAEALHVRDQVHRFSDDGELLGADSRHEEEGAGGVGPDDVAEQAQAVVVGPLEVVDQQRHRPPGSERAKRDRGEIERPEEFLVRGEARKARLLTAPQRVQASGGRFGRGGPRPSHTGSL